MKIGIDEIPDPIETSDASEKMTSLESDCSGSSDISSVPGKPKIGGVSSTPAIRNLAKQYGLDINDVPATGKDGRILKEDVINYAMQKGLIEAPACALQKLSEVSPLIGGGYEDKTLQLRLVTAIRRTRTCLRCCFYTLLEISDYRWGVTSISGRIL